MQDLSFISNMSDEDAYLFSISLWLPNLTATT